MKTIAKQIFSSFYIFPHSLYIIDNQYAFAVILLIKGLNTQSPSCGSYPPEQTYVCG